MTCAGRVRTVLWVGFCLLQPLLPAGAAAEDSRAYELDDDLRVILVVVPGHGKPGTIDDLRYTLELAEGLREGG